MHALAIFQRYFFEEDFGIWINNTNPQATSTICNLLFEAELRSHSAWRTDDETPPTTHGPSQSGIQQISRTVLSTTHATPTIRKSPCCDMENNKNSSSRLPFSNSKTTSKTTRRSNSKTQNKMQQKQKKQNHKHRTHEQDMSTLQTCVTVMNGPLSR